MCKHKSGGMSKAQENNSQEGLSDRSAASVSSQDCPLNMSEVVGAQAMEPTLSKQGVPASSSKIKNYSVTTVINMQPPNDTSSICDTYNFLPSSNVPCDSKYDGLPFMPNLTFGHSGRQTDFLTTQDSEEEDSEQSPMLLTDTCGMYTSLSPSWNPNILTNEEIDHSSNHYANCDIYGYSGPDKQNQAANCDNFLLFHNYQTPVPDKLSYVQTPFQGVPCGGYVDKVMNNFDELSSGRKEKNYAWMHKKKWMLNQKCKSADSEPDTFPDRLVSTCRRSISPFKYNYGQSTNILDTHIRNCYLNKPVYSTNGDPIAGPSGLQRPCSINWDTTVNSVDSEFRSRSYSLTPTINFAVFESGSSSETEDALEPMVSESAEAVATDEVVKSIEDPFELPILPLSKVLSVSPSAAQLSIASSYGDNGSPICKICHMTAKENDPLISPCRCSGTMQYIHCGCLMRWLEVCHKRGRRPASCELCQYQYHWHKKFKIRHWQFPQCSRKDKILHLLFIFSALLMVSCASLTIMFFKQDKGTKVDMNQELTQSEIGNLVCGVLFFVAFFVAIYVEAKSHDTLYKLLVKFIHINQQWYIDEYEKKETAPVAV